MNEAHEAHETMISLILKWTIPFFLGLSSTFIIDWIRDFKKRGKNRKFIIFYLKETILPGLPEIETTAQKLRKKIENLTGEKFSQPAFESFNSNILKAIEPVEYYKIFGKKYVLLNEIITMIDYVSENLPTKISSNFYKSVNTHLKEKKAVGSIDHVKNCAYCQEKKHEALVLIDARIREIKLLKEKIQELTKS